MSFFSFKNLAKVFILALFFGCSEEMNEKPDNLIPESKMAAIVTDIMVTEAKVSRLGFKSFDSSKVAYDFLEREIFKKYAVDSAQYNQSYNYYNTDGKGMLRILDIAKQNAEKLKETSIEK